MRIGVVNHLNAQPLWRTLQDDPSLAVIPDTPARLTRRMADGEFDVCLLPVVEVLRQPDLTFYPDLGIAADGIVESVGLFTRDRTELGTIRSVALTGVSRTSHALTRVLLHAAGARAELVEADVGPEDLVVRTEDAVLLIGDACLCAVRPGFESGRVYVDLAAEWAKLTGLPFVFAVWAGPASLLTAELHERLRRALADGEQRLAELARDAVSITGWTEAELVRYLGKTIQHRLTPAHLNGLAEFAGRGADLGLLPLDAKDKVLGVASRALEIGPATLEQSLSLEGPRAGRHT